jgi:hypothetical protein
MVAASFDVSDKAIEKRCKLLGVPKPPRGYWAKLQNGVSHREALFELGWLWEEIEEIDERLAMAEESMGERCFQFFDKRTTPNTSKLKL